MFAKNQSQDPAAKSSFSQKEEVVLKYWEENEIFKKTLAKDSPQGEFVFFEGPPTANGRPGIHHILARSFKDIIPRYKTMRGYHVLRKGGWDTHGLPVELQVEKQLGISGKPEIEKYGVEQFNQKCKQSVWQYKDEWEKLTKRIGYWVDLDDAYITYNNEYMESLWWILQQAEQNGFLYKGYKVVPHCPRCGTALSSHEVAQGYKEVEDTSVFIKFKVKNIDNTFILSWTTTPWTLPGNVGLAVGGDIEYVKVKKDDQYLFVARDLADIVLDGDYEIVETLQGRDLVGIEYEALFPGSIDPKDKKAWFVQTADFVATGEGTGVVHTAVMYGEDDFDFGRKYDLPAVHTVGEDGKFLPCVSKWAGRFVKDSEVEQEIITDLQERGLLLRELKYKHEYPFCWRCESPLLYYAKDSWFIKMSDFKEKLLQNNQTINWVPEHIKNGRFGEWLSNVKDWAISRQRYWGTPIPIWECKQCGQTKVVGSMQELQELCGRLPLNQKGETDLHRPYIDKLSFECSCGGRVQRVSDVFDCWYDSGSMPFAQQHYPFANKEMIDQGVQFPADYISEGIDQTRGWFYTLLAVSTVLGKGAPYKNVICLGHIRDNKGKKMSKSKGNVVDPWMVADKYGMDALRMHFYSINQPGDPKNFDENSVREILRKVVMLLANLVGYYELYKNDEQPDSEINPVNVLDRWVIAKLNLFIKEVENDLDQYHVFEASRRIISFIDEVSTWYLRRSRDRFKTDGSDKREAVKTLHHVLSTLIKVMAPFTPFCTEAVYQRLGGSKKSVHLEDWPVFQDQFIDQKLLAEMKTVQKLVETVHSLRAVSKIKLRQPLAELRIKGADNLLSQDFSQIIAQEVNVKKISAFAGDELFPKWQLKTESGLSVALDVEPDETLKKEGIVRELVRNINGYRKKNGLTIKDFVILNYDTDDKYLAEVIEQNKQELSKSVLASEILRGQSLEGDWKTIKINGTECSIMMEKRK